MRTKRKQKVVEIYTYSALDEMMASPTAPMPEPLRRHQLTRMWQGLAAMETDPKPTTDDWRVCSDAVNLMKNLVEQGTVADASGLLDDAIRGLVNAGARSLDGGPIRLDGPGIQAVRAVLEDYAAVLEVLSHRAMIRCHRDTERRIRDIYKGKKRPGDVEVMAL